MRAVSPQSQVSSVWPAAEAPALLTASFHSRIGASYSWCAADGFSPSSGTEACSGTKNASDVPRMWSAHKLAELAGARFPGVYW
jgi:hypothetical protein